MTPELKALEQAIIKKRRHCKRHARSAGIDEIREAFKEYKKSLEKALWHRVKVWLFKKRWNLKGGNDG